MNIRASLAAATLLAVPFLTTGCSTSFNPALSGGVVSQNSAPVRGRVMGGQQPITGANIYLFQAGLGGYGGQATSLLGTQTSTDPNASPVQYDTNGNGYVATDAYGRFDITGSYQCSANDSQVYLVSTGGDAGGGANPAAVLMLALGDCGGPNGLPTRSFISINELSTVAAVTALQQFIGAGNGANTYMYLGSNSNTFGLQNAMKTASALVGIASGGVNASTTNLTIPEAKLYTLADSMAACVNSAPTPNGSGGTTPSSGCSGFFSAAYIPAGSLVTVTDTLSAMLQIAQYPAYNTSAVITNVPTVSAFGNALSAAPNDWSLPISYHGGGLGSNSNNNVSATSVAIDGNGSAWVAVCGVSCGETQADSVVEISPSAGTFANGYISSGSGGFGVNSVHFIQSLAIDQSNTVYTVNGPTPGATGNAFNATPSISVIGPSGAVKATITNSNNTPAGSFASPAGIAIDANATAVVTDPGNQTIYSVSQSGVVNTSYITPNGNTQNPIAPSGIALDYNGTIIVDDPGALATLIYTPAIINQNLTYVQTVSQNGATAPTAVAITQNHNFWQLNPGTAQVYKLTEGGQLAPCNGTCATDGGSSAVTLPNAASAQNIAVDGGSELLVPVCSSNCSGAGPGSLVILTDEGVPVQYRSGLQDDSIANPVGIAVDGSGNAWIANGSTGAVTEFVGVAAPTVTPLSSALQLMLIGSKP